ncbi:MAG TPA: GntR family transcriptional regulator [Gemmataceae bacterium]|nr:GntR family transcriptional regulator [Gemmataceae bacterium]
MMPRTSAKQTARSPRANRNGSQPVPRRSGSASARVYEALREQILAGDLPAGTHLSQQALAVAMKTSNGPVISALRRLAYEGLVIHKPGQGCRVCDWSQEKCEDLLTVRRALETEAARLAARRAGPEDLERLRGIVARMAEMVRQGRRDGADAIDVEFHVAVARLTRSPGLIEALGRCHLQELVRRRLAANARFGDFENLAVNHQRLVDAIASGDPDAAGRAMHLHLTPRSSSAPVTDS